MGVKRRLLLREDHTLRSVTANCRGSHLGIKENRRMQEITQPTASQFVLFTQYFYSD
jgi:hypothetical protein